MRRAVFLVLVFSIATTANAEMFISVDGVVNPSNDIYLTPSDTAIIDIWVEEFFPWAVYYFGIIEGDPASLDFSQMVVPYPGEIEPRIILDPPDYGFGVEFKAPVLKFTYGNDNPPPGPVYVGKLVDNIILHCDGIGDVTMVLFHYEGGLADSQTIHQVPEPGVVALLVFGAMMLRRRRQV